MSEYKHFRTVPYGHPPKGDNEVLNPGRFKNGPYSCMGYYDSAGDPWTFVLVDKLMADTPADDNTRAVPPYETPNPNPNSTSDRNYPIRTSHIPNEDGIMMPYLLSRGEAKADEPSYEDDYWIVNRKNTWQSGPPVNGGGGDNAVPGVSYYTDLGGPNAPDPAATSSGAKKRPGFEMNTKSDRPILLFNMGHGNVASQAGLAASNVVGWDGYLYADPQGSGVNKTATQLAVCHAYAMYTCDLTLDEKIDLVKALVAWVQENFPDEIEGRLFTNYEGPVNERIKSQVEGILRSGTRTPSVQLIIRVIKAIIKVIEQAQSDGVVGGNLVNWDFLGELTVPTNANEYLYAPDQTTGELSDSDKNKYYKWGEYGGSWKARRFSYVIESDTRAFMQILKLRTNGVLWHFSSPETNKLTIRIMRTFNFAHIYSASIVSDLDDPKNDKYLQVLPEYKKDRFPHAWYDEHFYFDTRGS